MNEFINAQKCLNKYCKDKQNVVEMMVKQEAKKIEDNFNKIKTFADVKKYYKKFLLNINNKANKEAEECEMKHCATNVKNVKKISSSVFDMILPIVKTLQKKPIYTDEVIKDINRLLALPILNKTHIHLLSFYMLLTSIIVSKGM